MNDRYGPGRIVGYLLLWLFGVAALAWVGSRLLHDAFGWFATQPSWTEACLVAVWFGLAILWLMPVGRSRP